MFEVDGRSGDVAESDLASTWGLAGGHVAGSDGGDPTILDVASGEVLLSVDAKGDFQLSADDRYAYLLDQGAVPGEDAGERVVAGRVVAAVGWCHGRAQGTPSGARCGCGDGRPRSVA